MLGLLALGGCDAAGPAAGAVAARDAVTLSVRPEETRMWMIVGDRRFAVTLADNATAQAFAAQLPLALDMSELNGNEKYAQLPEGLPTNARRAGTIRSGDLMLYGTDTVVIFYADFRSPYSYTRLGRVEDPDGLAEALGSRGVRIVFSKR
jgi:hypothetical protein